MDVEDSFADKTIIERVEMHNQEEETRLILLALLSYDFFPRIR